MTLADLIPFKDAVMAHGVKSLLPTTLSSEELSTLSGGIKRLAMFSARTDSAWYVQQISDAVEDVLNPHTTTRPDRVSDTNPAGKVTEGMDRATAELRLKEAIDTIGYQPAEGEKGTIKDLSSMRRRRLVVETNVQLAQGAGKFLQGQDPDVLDAFPAQELVRFQAKVHERDWHERWLRAAEYSGDEDAARVLNEFGRMVARKDSPIWDALGDPDLFDDALGNPYPPFAFQSGMWVMDVDWDTAVKMGLVKTDETIEPQELEFADRLELPKEIRDARLLEELVKEMGNDFEIGSGGVLRVKNRRDGGNNEATRLVVDMLSVLDALSGRNRNCNWENHHDRNHQDV